MHLLVEWFLFWIDDVCFLKEGVKTYLMTPMSLLKPTFFSVFTSIVYDGWDGIETSCSSPLGDVHEQGLAK